MTRSCRGCRSRPPFERSKPTASTSRVSLPSSGSRTEAGSRGPGRTDIESRRSSISGPILGWLGRRSDPMKGFPPALPGLVTCLRDYRSQPQRDGSPCRICEPADRRLRPRPSTTRYETPGGVFVSFRRRIDDDRIARDGFWRFGPITTTAGEDLVYATVHTVRMAGGKLDLPTVDRCKVGVTTLGPLIASRPADLDFDRYGIVVRDRVSGHKLGGALPNTQVFTAEAGQYWQARLSNARLVPGEEHDLFRHELTKHLEPGERWLSYGAPDGPELAWRRDGAFGDAVTRIAREECLAALGIGAGLAAADRGHVGRAGAARRRRGEGRPGGCRDRISRRLPRFGSRTARRRRRRGDRRTRSARRGARGAVDI